MASLTCVFGLCQETHQRPFSVANSSNIAFKVPLASELLRRNYILKIAG